MGFISSFLDTATSLQTVFFWISVISTAFLLMQVALTFMGGDIDSDMDVDADGGDFDAEDVSGLKFFTVRNLVAFMVGFGLFGLWASTNGWSNMGAVILGTFMGILAVVMVTLLMLLMYKMQYSGTIQPSNAIGKEATVYLTVNEKGKPGGKITVELGGASRVVDAVSAGRKFSTGERVKVVDMSGTNMVVDNTANN